MKIVFDSTVLVSNFHMTGPSFRLLEWFLKNRQARLVVPRIVLAEVKNKYLEQAKECIEAASKELRGLSRILDHDFKIPVSLYDLGDYHETYSKSLERKLTDLEAEMPDHKDIPHEDIVARDLSRRRPFRRIGKNKRYSVGYRDTLLWEVILREVAPESDLVVFITGNRKDFCEESTGELHEHLQRDLIRRQLARDRVIVVDRIELFDDQYVRPEIPKIEEAKILLEQGKYYGFSVEEWLDENSMELASKLEEQQSALDFLPVDIDAFSIELIEDIHDLCFDEVLELDEDTVVIDISFRASVSFELYFYGHAYVILYEDFYDSISVEEWPDDRGATVSIHFTMPINGSLMFDIENREVESFEASFQEAYGVCRYCGELFLSDAAETCPNCGR